MPHTLEIVVDDIAVARTIESHVRDNPAVVGFRSFRGEPSKQYPETRIRKFIENAAEEISILVHDNLDAWSEDDERATFIAGEIEDCLIEVAEDRDLIT